MLLTALKETSSKIRYSGHEFDSPDDVYNWLHDQLSAAEHRYELFRSRLSAAEMDGIITGRFSNGGANKIALNPSISHGKRSAEGMFLNPAYGSRKVEFEKWITKHNEALERFTLLKREVNRIKRMIESGFDISDSPKEHNAVTVPKEIPTGTGKSIHNPYWLGVEATRFAGNPRDYVDLTTSQVKILIALNAALKRVGHEQLTMLFGARRGGVAGPINFVATSPAGDVVWYKYDMGSGSGMNYMYFNGHKYFASQVWHKGMTDAQVDKQLLKMFRGDRT